jgi:all-trans-retinol 13,14-reductase
VGDGLCYHPRAQEIAVEDPPKNQPEESWMSIIPTHDGKRVYRDYSHDTNGPWDVIVIGSGMGGMACAAALAKSGRRVLVLEQHYIPGGFTHSFGRKGWHWDAGVHAIGEMSEGDIPRSILDWLTDGEVEMVSLGNPYDRFRFHDGLTIEFANSKKAYVGNLKSLFPDQVEALDRYFEMVEKAAVASMAFFGLKSMPEAVDRVGSAIVNAIGRDWWAVTTSEILDEAGIEGKLRTVLTVHWGYYGSIPSESSFAIHALTHTHFWNGAFYPRGGSKVFAQHLLRQVDAAGGDVLTRASVEELVVEDGRVVGVRMEDQRVLRAPVVVSAAGVKTTVRRLLPERERASEWAQTLNELPDSPSYICLNLGFHGDIREDGASAANLWLFETYEREQKAWDLSDPDSEAHILYISFPSLKDPDYDPGKKVRHTGECVTFLDWDLFRRWVQASGQRDDDYLSLKKDIEDRLLAQLRRRIPGIMSKLAYCELSTPITTMDYTRASQGAIYGLAATPERFTCSALRTRTPLTGFYMTGVDVASLGVVGAMTSGLLTAATIVPKLYTRLLFPQLGLGKKKSA